MATTTTATATNNGVYLVAEDYKDTPTLKLCHDYTKKGELKTEWLFNRGPVAWGRLFGADREGDNVLMMVFEWLHENHEDAPSVVNGMDEFVRKYLAWRAEYFGCDNADLVG